MAGAAVLGLLEASVRLVPPESSWDTTLGSVLTSLAPICPGLVAGYLAARSGFLVGSIASVLTSILNSIYLAMIDSAPVAEGTANPAIPQEITFALVAILVGGVCGIAGAAVATRGDSQRGE
jgi:hypothetical protein